MTAIAINEYPLVSARIDTLYDEVLASLTKNMVKEMNGEYSALKELVRLI